MEIFNTFFLIGGGLAIGIVLLGVLPSVLLVKKFLK